MEAVTITRSPFDLPELRYRLSRFVSVKDALSCALVSKAWTHDFMSAIWFRVDFNVNCRFADLSPDIIAKHGHHIRVVKNANQFPRVHALDNSNVNKLRDLRMEIKASTIHHLNTYQIVARNNTSIQDLELFSQMPPFSEHHGPFRHVSAPAFIPFPGASQGKLSSTLETLNLIGLWLTHDELLTILESSPNLSKLRLYHTQIVESPTRSFQHLGVSLLAWPLKSIFPQEQSTSSPLLSYFPNLTILHTWKGDQGYTVPTARIKRELARHCPRLTEFKLAEYTGNMAAEFLTDIANNVSRITFELDYLTPETIEAILLHQATLKKVAHFYNDDFNYDKEKVATVSHHFHVTDEMMQQIPRKCSQLQRLNLHRHEMDMDAIEKTEWACKDLRKLRIRVKDLDTKRKILKAIKFWRAGYWRRKQRKSAGTMTAAAGKEEERLAADQSIEARVARHLLKFEHLQWVWLGYQMWTPV
ncbi:hypothetical protein BGW39_008501 [Mortierella sp. 14UC]|nr:hypothetical protein BGW39_008501 [Mortierella sp. 14UC]